MTRPHALSGLRDKLFWRPASGRWHCFKKADEANYVSLCGDLTRSRSGGQSILRPPPLLRCARCDAREMDRRGWEESGPPSPNWRDAL